MTTDRIQEELREWIAKKNKKPPDTIGDETNLIEEGMISSLDTLELIFLIESLGGKIGKLRAGVFENLNVIVKTFFVT
jgi:acyl carrier protein